MRKRNRKAPCRKLVLRLPDLDQAKFAVLNSLSSPCSRRNYTVYQSVGNPTTTVTLLLFQRLRLELKNLCARGRAAVCHVRRSDGAERQLF